MPILVAVIDVLVAILPVIATVLTVVGAIIAIRAVIEAFVTRREAVLKIVTALLRRSRWKLARALTNAAGTIAHTRQKRRAAADRARQSAATAGPSGRQLADARTLPNTAGPTVGATDAAARPGRQLTRSAAGAADSSARAGG